MHLLLYKHQHVASIDQISKQLMQEQITDTVHAMTNVANICITEC